MNDGSTDETWRAIPGYDGWYEVSNLGRVRSWKMPTNQKVAGPRRRAEPLILRPAPTKTGYMKCALFSTAMKTWTVHQLVALAFIGPRPEGAEIAHGNGVKADNRLANLRYATHAENMADNVLNGVNPAGAHHPLAKLTEAEVRMIRASDECRPALAARLGVSLSAISDVRNRKTWTHVA